MKREMGLALVAGAADFAMAEALRREGYEVHGLGTAEASPSAYRTMTVVAEGSEREAMLACVARLRPEVLVPVGMRFTYAACRDWAIYGKQTGLLAPPLSGFEAAWKEAERALWCERLGIPAAGPREIGDGGEEGSKTALLLFGADSRLRAAFTASGPRRISSWEPDLVEQVLPFFTVWAWRGPVEVEFRFDRRERREKVTSMLPFWAGSLPVVAAAYPGMLAMVARLVRGEEVAAERYPAYAAGRQEPLR